MWGCAVAVWFFLVGVGDAAHPRTTAPKKILFIGNSMTYVGDLPKQVARLAAEHNFGAVVCDMEAPGGVTLKQHWESGKAQKMIQTGNYDAVVIQGQSTESLDDLPSFKTYGIKFAEEASKYHATPYLFSVWSTCSPFACNAESLAQAQTSIDGDYADVAKATGAVIVPVGWAWAAYRTAHPSPIGVLTSDNAHPNNMGAYLNAAVFFESLFDKSSLGSKVVTGVSDAAAKEMQTIAHAVVSKMKVTPNEKIGNAEYRK